MEGKWEVFETPDVPDLTVNVDDISNEERRKQGNVISLEGIDGNLPPAPEKVFEVFAGKRFVTGGRSERCRPEVSGNDVSSESPFERYNRLRMEVEELANDLSLNSDSQGEPVQNSVYTELSSGVKTLRETLGKLELDAKNATALSTCKTGDLNIESSQALKTQLDAIQAPESDSTCVQYELFYSNEQRGALNQVKQEQLETRVRRLEQILGLDTTTGTLPSTNNSKPLTHLVSQLEKKVGNLDEGKLTMLTQKAKVFSTAVDDLNKQRQAQGGLTGLIGSASSLEERDLHEMVQKLERCDSIAATLPTLIARLQTVQEIHQHNAHYHKRLDAIDSQHEQLLEDAKLDRQLLDDLKRTMRENVDIVQENLRMMKESN
uniref:Dynactin subunit 2 n=1 Tax=Mucochytrium quahogii TaxID=96639 RepID=A0A7S2W845_9STRA|mmetsp:Transcript_38171/g.61955  ORF Transcript_38171/g.61955 Transcript_38171/m.61955 type:complete len:377 (-) Transcript_38171:467-1597(-)|eukprot:CAMPEP_0203760444 /NCGR_PEP_ID=MMETSP0098-20131031/13732_1 /ASSEMBLY_ACC=CAM_ASM_000208 /TAXON_ID=96639 /ORGANISM=" , Strain NY0313808BC1" /LENGTH=376 /DNA_ID=CAMNT_0050654001 /DNA_START=115 /DNA_END=1245 /DNA_ORIENTATION=-